MKYCHLNVIYMTSTFSLVLAIISKRLDSLTIFGSSIWILVFWSKKYVTSICSAQLPI